ALPGCGGGGGGTAPAPTPPNQPPPPPPPPSGPSGTLAFRNSGQVALHDFGSNSEVVFDVPTEASIHPGVSASPAGLISVAVEGDNSGFDFSLYDLNGALVNSYTVAR